MTKQLLLIGTAVMTTLLALVALWQFRVIVLYVVISLVLAATFRRMRKSETRHNFRTRLLLVLQYVVGFGVAAILVFLIGRFLVGDFQQLAEKLSSQNLWVIPAWLEGGYLQRLLAWLPTPDKLFEAVTSQRQMVLSAVLGLTQGIGGFVSASIVILILSVYWSVNQNHFERLWLSLIPSEQRKSARYIWRTIEHDIGAYARSEIIQSVLAIILLGIGYWLIGSPYPTLLAVTGAIAWLVPVVGAALAIILPFLLGLLTNMQLSIFSVLYTLIVLVALQVWVEPRLFKFKWDNPVLTSVILLALADAFGLLGIIAAPPISVICQIVWNLLVNDRLAADPSARVQDLREHQARLDETLKGMEGTPPPLVVSSMERLNKLLEKAEPILQEALATEPPDVFRQQ